MRRYSGPSHCNVLGGPSYRSITNGLVLVGIAIIGYSGCNSSKPTSPRDAASATQAANERRTTQKDATKRRTGSQLVRDRNRALEELHSKFSIPQKEDNPWVHYSPVVPPKFPDVEAGGKEEYRFQKVADLPKHKAKVTHIVVAPDARMAVTCDSNASLVFWDLEKHAALASQDVVNHGGIHSIAISPDSKVALVSGEKGILTKWDIHTGKNIGKLEIADEHFQNVAFASDPNIAAVMTGGTFLAFVDVGSMAFFDLIDLHTTPFANRASQFDTVTVPPSQRMLTFIKDSTQIVIAKGESVISFQIPHGEQAATVKRKYRPQTGRYASQPHGRYILDHAVVIQDQYIAAAFDDGRVTLAAADSKNPPTKMLAPGQTSKSKVSFSGRPTKVRDLAELPGGHILAAYAGGESCDLWNIDQKPYLGFFDGSTAGVSAATICPDGRHAVSGYEDGRLILFELPKPTVLYDPRLDDLPNSARNALLDDKFDELETIGAELRKARHTCLDGDLCYPKFYRVLCQPEEQTEVEWIKLLKHLEDWLAAKKDSTLARIALANAYERYGWEARGTGFVGTVSANAMALFEERLRLAAKHLVEAQKLDPNDPAIYDAEIRVGKGLGIGKERLQTMLDAGLKADATYLPLYISMAPCLLQRWYGEEDDIAKFLDHVLSHVKGDDGLAIYSLIFGELKCYESINGLQLLGFDMEKVSAGANVLHKRYPFSAKAGSLACWCACYRRDRDDARDLFGWLGDTGDNRIWGSTATRERLRHWAFDDWYPTNAEKCQLVSFQALTSLAFSPDGKTIAVGGDEQLQQVTIWDVQNSKRIAILPHPGDVYSLDFSPDGKHLVTAGGTNDAAQLVVWQLGEKVEPRELKGPVGCVRCTRFSPDGRVLAAGGIDKTVWLWKTDDFEAKPTQINLNSEIRNLSFGANGEKLAVATPKECAVFSVSSLKPIAHKSVSGIQFWDTALNDEKFFVTADPYYVAACPLDGTDGQQLAYNDEPFPRKFASRIDISPNGKLIAVAVNEITGKDRPQTSQIRIFDTESNEELSAFPVHYDRTTGLRFSPDGKHIATVSWDGTMRLWGLPSFSPKPALGPERKTGGVIIKPTTRVITQQHSDE